MKVFQNGYNMFAVRFANEFHLMVSVRLLVDTKGALKIVPF